MPKCDLIFYRIGDKLEVIYSDELLSVLDKYCYDLPGFIHNTKVLDKTGIVDFISVSDDTSDFIKDLTLQALKDNMTQEEIDEMNEKYGDPLTEKDKAEIAEAWDKIQDNPQFKEILSGIPKWDEE